MTIETELPDAACGGHGLSGLPAAPSPFNPDLQDLPPHPNAVFAAQAMSHAAHGFAPGITAGEVAAALREAMDTDADGESLLFTQAQSLDLLFHRLTLAGFTRKTLTTTGENMEFIRDGHLSLALRMQYQCRRALESVAVLRSRRQSAMRDRDQALRERELARQKK